MRIGVSVLRVDPEKEKQLSEATRKWALDLIAANAGGVTRLDHPMLGKRKLGPILRRQGFAVSDATVGRIVGELILRGGVAKVPALIRKAAERSATPCTIRSP